VKQSLEKKKEAAARIKTIALHLHSNGEYPSRKRIQKTLNGRLGLSNPDVGAVLRELRGELGLSQRT
jgi:hypothetical protein